MLWYNIILLSWEWNSPDPLSKKMMVKKIKIFITAG
jgi:hypothetical protein